MFTLFVLILVAIGIVPLYFGKTKNNNWLTGLGVAWLVALACLLVFLALWPDKLWFEALGYEQRFWIIIQASVLLLGAGALIGGAGLYLLMLPLRGELPFSKWWAVGIGGLLTAIRCLSNREEVLLFLNRVEAGVSEPVLGMDAGFYLFSLPVLDMLYQIAATLSVLGLGAVVIYSSLRRRGEQWNFESGLVGRLESGAARAFYINAAVLLAVLGVGKLLDRYHLLYSDWGVVNGPGWTDVIIRLPMLWVAGGLSLLAAAVVLLPALRSRFEAIARKVPLLPLGLPANTVVLLGGGTLLLWFVLLSFVPKAFQWLRVEPNEITLEAPYIANNIKLTRHGFQLDVVEEREFPASGAFNQEMVDRNDETFTNIRLWDWRALDSVYKQFQEIRLYYEFVDVDIDRYHVGEDYREVMVAAREMKLANLPSVSQTFVNRHFKYTHGYGVAMSIVSEFTPQGLPRMLIKDIPPKSQHPDLEVEQPQIYYGELTNDFAVVNTSEAEFDYPSGDQNISIHYPGTGGVSMESLWHKFLFAWHFDSIELLLSGYPREGTRIMLRRNVRQRLQHLAPFLHFDLDPYVVVCDGRLYWIVDAYTVSDRFPYSEAFSNDQVRQVMGERASLLEPSGIDYLRGANYIRNSVKVVVDAFDGSVDFYVYEPDDPLIRAWSNVFPEMFTPKDDMPEAFRKHVRYPSDFLLTQGLVYAKYHMTDPEVFYNQEDLWILATEKYYKSVQAVEPYYVMWEPPEADKAEFVLIMPFTPKNRQVLIGWIAGMCDPENYGRFLAYKFPKERRMLGPQQVETKIDQDPELSAQLSLWDQRGSQVIRGNVLAIPVEDTLIYVEPIYLEAETAAYPELRLVAVMHEDDLSYAPTFSEALRGLFGEAEARRGKEKPGPAAVKSVEVLVGQASQAFENYLDALGGKRFSQASEALQLLQKALTDLVSTIGQGAAQQTPSEFTPRAPDAPDAPDENSAAGDMEQ